MTSAPPPLSSSTAHPPSLIPILLCWRQMPHLFGWSTINPKVRGKDRTERDQSHLGGGVGAGLGVPVSLGGEARLHTPLCSGQLPRLLQLCPVCDLRQFWRVTRKARVYVCVCAGREKKMRGYVTVGKSIFWTWTFFFCFMDASWSFFKQVNVEYEICNSILSSWRILCFLFL